jgi:hydroxypyruvate isomerase
MNRREFLRTSIAAGAALASTSPMFAAISHPSTATGRFSLNYAPHFGTFRNLGGQDLLDQIRFMADEGFVALEDYGLRSKSVDVQRQIARELDRRGMQMGIFTGFSDFGRASFASGDRGFRNHVRSEMKETVETARRMNAHWCAIVPGKRDSRLPMAVQTKNAIDTLKSCVDLCEPAELTMLVEPLNHWGRRPRLFLHKMSQAYHLCHTVGSPHCKLLFDVSQQHEFNFLQDRDVVEQIERCWTEIGYLHFADNPGRKEPGCGEIDFGRIVSLLRAKNYRGIIGMEHGSLLPGASGERAVIDAYARLERC